MKAIDDLGKNTAFMHDGACKGITIRDYFASSVASECMRFSEKSFQVAGAPYTLEEVARYAAAIAYAMADSMLENKFYHESRI